jgi:glycosyltransferase involved in cell wall biosynthesis
VIDCATLKKTGVALLASRLCVLGDDPCGGSEVVLWEDVHILESAGIPVRVYGRAASSGVPVQIIPFRTRTAQLNTIEYVRALLRNEPEALMVAYNEPAVAGFAPHRTIVRFDWTTPLPRYWDWPLWLSRFQRARYLFPSDSERQSFLDQHARIPASQLVVIPNAVDLEVFKPGKLALRGGSDRSLRVGFAGQWSAGKGLQILLQAWKELRSSLPTADLCLAGGPRLWKRHREAPGTRESEARVQEMEREHLLCSYGSISRAKMPDFWNSVDIAVVPSLSEAFGLVALEALGCGVPVIASAIGGLKEVIVDGDCGLLVPPGDTAALVRALRLLLTDESLRLRLGAAARARAQQFSLLRRSRELVGLLLERSDKAA